MNYAVMRLKKIKSVSGCKFRFIGVRISLEPV